MGTRILVVDDERDIRILIRGILEDEGYQVEMAASSKEAYESIAAKKPDLVILDIWLQGSEQDGMEILRQTKTKYAHLPVIMISGHGTIETAVSSIKEGAYDFIEKPFKADRLLLMIQRALETADLKRENEALKLNHHTTSKVDFIGQSSVVQNLRQVAQRVALTNSRVLLTGAPGTGKDLMARFLYQNSERARESFMVLSCATLRPERLEMELFGCVEDGQGGPKIKGVLEQANGGTLFLDEVADMPLETQGKVVRVIQEQRFQKIGSDEMIEVDIRIIASSNRDLESLIKDGLFREDLYYRLNVVPIAMPLLQEYAQDIPVIVEYFTELLHETSGLPKASFSKSALKVLQSYKWPGNVRQLKNVVEWALIMHGAQGGDEITAEGLPPEITGRDPALMLAEKTNSLLDADFTEMPLREAREAFEREYLEAQVERFEGNISQTAKFVGMDRAALHRKLKTLQKQDKQQVEQQKRA